MMRGNSSRIPPVDEALQKKIAQALEVDKTWRGAEPLEDVLDKRHRPDITLEQASLIGVDGSQIYPDTHGPALYYLINIGSMILRQGSGEAPITSTSPELFYDEGNLYDQSYNLVGTEEISTRRELAEMQALAGLSVFERKAQGGDLDHLVVAMKDGPLMLWLGERESRESSKTLQTYIDHLDTVKHSNGVPVGLTDRPRSANVMRLLWVAGLNLEDISQGDSAQQQIPCPDGSNAFRFPPGTESAFRHFQKHIKSQSRAIRQARPAHLFLLSECGPAFRA